MKASRFSVPPRSIVIAPVLLACAAIAAWAQPHFDTHDRPGSRHRLRHPITKPQPAGFGSALPGLNASQLSDFADGLAEFESEDTPESGLGPVFNNVSCAICHSVPAAGGGSALLETRFGHAMRGRFDPLAAEGGSLLQLFAIVPACKEVLPADANVVSQRLATPLFGLGLIEAIPDNVILQNANRRRSDGITGRAAQVLDVATGEMRIGRYGWKAQQATVLSFAGDAYLNEMGITSRLFPDENPPNGDTNLLAQYDLVPDPEDQADPLTGKSDIDRFTDFMRFLAPPPPLPMGASARAGQPVFSQIGCANCHVPSLTTGPNSIRPLDRKTVPLYSDLLLHDMGSLNDGIGQADAEPNEMKTAPLWGLRVRGPFLHDGRATTVDQAIRAHDGEAAAARKRYLQLSPSQRQQLLDFLNSI